MEPKPDDFNVDILLRPKAAFALVVLLLADRALTAEEFADALILGTKAAAKLRAYLLAHGLIVVQEQRLFIRVSLSEKGRRIAQHLLNVRKLTHGDAWDKTDIPFKPGSS